MQAAIESLEDLVAPLEEPEFLELLRTRTLRFERGPSRNRRGSLLDWQGLRGMIEAGTIPGESIRITKKTIPLPSPFYFEDGKVVGERLDRLMSQGASLIVERINRHVPALAALCATIRSRTADKVKVGAIATMGGGGALPFHFDEDDLLILQLEGSKRWRVSGPPVPYPVAGLNLPPPQTSGKRRPATLCPMRRLFRERPSKPTAEARRGGRWCDRRRGVGARRRGIPGG